MLVIAILLAGGLLVGCSNGEKMTKASGILKVNGQPVTGTTGTIEFYPVGGGRTANAAVQDDGSFVISYRQPGDGLPPGKYKVAVIADIYKPKAVKAKPKTGGPDLDDGFMGEQSTEMIRVVPSIYNSITSTPLEKEIVDDGKSQYIEIDISTKK